MWSNGGLYNSWVTFLDRWGAGGHTDPTTLPQVTPEDFTGDTWERLVRHLTAALSWRLGAWADALTAALAGAADEFTVARALHQARRGLASIRAVAGHPGLPADLAARLLDAVETQVGSAQRGLEEGVERMRRAGVDRSAVEARLRTVRENALTIPVTAENGGAGEQDPWASDPATAPRRRVVVVD